MNPVRLQNFPNHPMAPLPESSGVPSGGCNLACSVTLAGKDFYSPHFAAGETEAQKDAGGLPKA